MFWHRCRPESHERCNEQISALREQVRRLAKPRLLHIYLRDGTVLKLSMPHDFQLSWLGGESTLYLTDMNGATYSSPMTAIGYIKLDPPVAT